MHHDPLPICDNVNTPDDGVHLHDSYFFESSTLLLLYRLTGPLFIVKQKKNKSGRVKLRIIAWNRYSVHTMYMAHILIALEHYSFTICLVKKNN